MQNIKNIIFDYGNVIFNIDFARAQNAFAELGIPRVEEIYAHHAQGTLFDDFDRGRITPAEFRDGIRALAGRADLSDQQIDQAWNALLGGVPAVNHELLQRFKEQYRTFLLSNNNEIHYQWILNHLNDQFGLPDNSSLFEKTHYSHLMGMRKPDREIFEAVLDEHGLQPKQTLFIDDSPQHLQTAKSLGLYTIMIPSADYFEEMTRELGLLKH